MSQFIDHHYHVRLCDDQPCHHQEHLGIVQILTLLFERLNEMSQDQDKLNADVAAITDSVRIIGSAIQSISDEIAALKNTTTSPSLDFSGLDAAVATLASATTSLESLEPAPAPAPVPTPDPAPPADPVPPTA